jgi:RimJ/RimL family protein N-acetyltransferase
MTLLAPTDQLETERLILRRMDAGDLHFFIAIHGDPDVARYTSGKPRPSAETEAWFQDVQDSYAKAGLGPLTVIRKADGVLLGRCGLSDAALDRVAPPGGLRRAWLFSAHAPADADIECIPELGYTFGAEHWGKGYASEAARAVHTYARTHRAFADIMSVIHPDNSGSAVVAAKFGVRFVDEVDVGGHPFKRYHWPLIAEH